MGLMDDDATMMERMDISLFGSPDVIKKVIIGYRHTSHVMMPLVIVLQEINFDSLSQGKENEFEESGLALYPKTQYFSYDKEGYIASLIGLHSESMDTLVFNHAERIDASKCEKDWENLILDLKGNHSIKISDEITIRRPENELIVLVCTEKPRFLRKGHSIHYHCIDLTDHNLKKSEAEKEYTDLAVEGDKILESNNCSQDTNSPSLEAGQPIPESSSNSGTIPAINEIDWEERRFQLVKAIVTGKLAGKGVYDIFLNDAHINQIIGTANKIIKRLKKC